jgi:hypothetical protein
MSNSSPSSTQKVPVEIQCDIDDQLAGLYLIFSIDNGNSWFEVTMEQQGTLYSISIPNVPAGVKVLYLFKAIGLGGEEFVENNGGQYFSKIAGQVEATGYSVSSSNSAYLDSDMVDSAENRIEQPTPSENFSNSLPTPKVNSNIPSSESIPIPSNTQGSGAIADPQDQSATAMVSFPDNKSSSEYDENQKSTESLPPEFYDKLNPFQDPQPATNNNQGQVPYQEQNLSSDSTQMVTSNAKLPISTQEEKKPKPNSDFSRPIIPYNPFPVDYGELQNSADGIQSFSQIISAKLTTPPSKKRSFIKRPNMLNSKVCTTCKANINLKWKICAICGSKA